MSDTKSPVCSRCHLRPAFVSMKQDGATACNLTPTGYCSSCLMELEATLLKVESDLTRARSDSKSYEGICDNQRSIIADLRERLAKSEAAYGANVTELARAVTELATIKEATKPTPGYNTLRDEVNAVNDYLERETARMNDEVSHLKAELAESDAVARRNAAKAGIWEDDRDAWKKTAEENARESFSLRQGIIGWKQMADAKKDFEKRANDAENIVTQVTLVLNDMAPDVEGFLAERVREAITMRRDWQDRHDHLHATLGNVAKVFNELDDRLEWEHAQPHWDVGEKTVLKKVRRWIEPLNKALKAVPTTDHTPAPDA